METKISEQNSEENIADFNEEQVLTNITLFTSEKLADIIVLNRYLGAYEEIARAAMVELGIRRENGNDFKYEDYIDINISKLPKIQIKSQQSNNIYNFIKDQMKVKL